MQRAVRSVCGVVRAPTSRFFRAAPPLQEALDTEALLQLRRRTGLSFRHCREGLQRCGGDLQQAEAWLQEQAMQLGWSRAAALGGRQAREGLLGLLRDGPAAAMVEVNCETDFVARTPEFQQLVELAALGTLELSKQAAAAPPGSCTTHLLQEDELAQLQGGPGGGLLRDQFALTMGKVGEKLALRRAAWLRVPEPGGFVAIYAHGGGPVAEREGPVAMGIYGALVGCGVPSLAPPPEQLEEVGQQVAQHVVGMAPTSLGTPQDQPLGDTETRLLAQSFLLNPQLTVGQFLGQQWGGIDVWGFLRFHRGEETPTQENPPAPPA